jgi:hypothetical protein
MAKKTDLIRVDRIFADALRRQSAETGESIIDLSASLGSVVGKKKRDGRDPFGLTVVD